MTWQADDARETTRWADDARGDNCVGEKTGGQTMWWADDGGGDDTVVDEGEMMQGKTTWRQTMQGRDDAGGDEQGGWWVFVGRRRGCIHAVGGCIRHYLTRFSLVMLCSTRNSYV